MFFIPLLRRFRIAVVLYCILSINLAKLSDWWVFLFSYHIGHRNVVYCEHNPIDYFQSHTDFPAQSLHFRFGSVAPGPTLKSNVSISTPRTRYSRLAKPYPTGFSCYTQSTYKIFRLLEEIRLSDFSAYIMHYAQNIFKPNKQYIQ